MSNPSTNTVALTTQQKLAALGARFYSGLQWTPKAGDYYTSSRADLELYRVVKIEDGKVYTEYCTSPGNLADWPEQDFTANGFGPCRVWVPEWVLAIKQPDEPHGRHQPHCSGAGSIGAAECICAAEPAAGDDAVADALIRRRLGPLRTTPMVPAPEPVATQCTCDYLGRGPHERGCPAIEPSAMPEPPELTGYAEHQLDAVDASVFNGDCYSEGNGRARLRWYIQRWTRLMDAQDAAEQSETKAGSES